MKQKLNRVFVPCRGYMNFDSAMRVTTLTYAAGFRPLSGIYEF